MVNLAVAFLFLTIPFNFFISPLLNFKINTFLAGCFAKYRLKLQKSKEMLSIEKVAQTLQYQVKEVCGGLEKAGGRSVSSRAKPESLLSVRDIKYARVPC